MNYKPLPFSLTEFLKLWKSTFACKNQYALIPIPVPIGHKNLLEIKQRFGAFKVELAIIEPIRGLSTITFASTYQLSSPELEDFLEICAALNFMVLDAELYIELASELTNIRILGPETKKEALEFTQSKIIWDMDKLCLLKELQSIGDAYPLINDGLPKTPFGSNL